MADSASAEAAGKPAQPYQALITGAIIDTLSGKAGFGLVQDTDRPNSIMVIKLQSAIDFTGGIALTNGSDSLPRPGSYEVTNDAEVDTSKTHAKFSVTYRKDIARFFRSRGGNVRIDHASDTLVTGSFNATMRGRLARGSQIDTSAEIRIRGDFRAKPGAAGYYIGL